MGADVKNGGRDIEVNAISTVFGRRQNANLTENEEVIYRSKNITPDQSALLDRPNSDQYPTEGELSSAAKLGNSSESSDKKSEKVAEGADNSVKEAAAEQQRPAERSNDSVHSIGATDTPGKVAAEREAVNTEPTDGQKEAGNYKKGHIKVDGFDITIENPKGSTRSGKDASGKAWSVPMHYDYGYIKGTEGVDGDHIDVYLSDDPTQGNVYVIDQVNQKDGSFDEHKVMYGFPSMKAAVDAYKGQYTDGWKVGTVTEVSREDFKKWVESSHRKTKPFAEYRSVQYTEPGDNHKPRENNYANWPIRALNSELNATVNLRAEALEKLHALHARLENEGYFREYAKEEHELEKEIEDYDKDIAEIRKYLPKKDQDSQADDVSLLPNGEVDWDTLFGFPGLPESDKASSHLVDPREMSDKEKEQRGNMLSSAKAIPVTAGQIKTTSENSARKEAEKWWQDHFAEPVDFNTEIGEVRINLSSIKDSLAHGYSQPKLDAITSLAEGFPNAVYLGSMKDFVRDGNVMNHYFAYPIIYNGQRCYVFCRAMQDANTNRLYVHEVFVGNEIKKGNTLQTAASQPHGGIALYRDILSNVLSAAKLGNSSESSDKKSEKVGVNGNKRADAVRNGGVAVDNRQAGAEAGARPAQGAATTTDEGLVRTHERTSLQNGEKGDVKQMKAGGGVASVSKREAVLRDAVVDLEREAGLDVIDDVEEGQRVLDMANGRVRQMSFGEPYDYDAYPLGRVEPNLAEKEVAVVEADANHGFANYKEAKAWAKQHVSKVYNNEETGGKGDVRISNAAIDKFMSQSAVDKSDGKDVHMSVLKVLPEVLKNSIDVETHPDFLKGEDGKRRPENGMNKDVLVHRCYGAVSIGGKPYRVKITLKEDPRDVSFPHVTHSYEATKIELLAGTLVKPEGDNPNTNNSISVANLLKNVGLSYNPSEKVLDASEKRTKSIREQRVYHGSAADFDAFDHSHMGEGEGAQAHGWGTYVTKNKGVGMTYASKSNKATGLKRSELESNIHRAEDQLPYLHGDVKAEKEKELKAWKDELAKLDDTKLVYTVEIPDDTGDNYLEEAQTLQDLNRPDMAGRIDKVMDDYFGAKDFWNSWQTPGLAMREEFIRLAMGQHLEKSRSDAERKYSKLLSEAGVVGLHYNGRKDGDCYVIFNDEDLKIKDKMRFFRTADGEAYGYTVGGKIYIDPRIATSETPIHEYAHLWAEALRKANPKEWQNVVELMKECKSVWEQVKKEYPELKTDDEIADEVLAHYSGRRGAERLRQEAAKATEEAKGVLDKASVVSGFGRLREAIKKAWKHIAEDILHIHFTSAEEVADKMMYDLLNKVKPGEANRADVSHGRENVEAANKRFNEELDAFKNKTSKGLLHLGTPSPILRSCGVAVKELTLSPSVLHQHLKKHGLTTDDLKNLVMGLRNPMLVYIHGLNVPNMVVVTSFDTPKGKLSIALRLDNNGQVVGINNISSVHGKDVSTEIDRLHEMGNDLGSALKYVDKEKVSDWLMSSPYMEAGTPNQQKLLSVAKIINDFENPVIKGENVSEPEVWEQSHGENVGERTHERTSLQSGVGADGYEAERSEIERKAKEDGTWMKAPNGRRSNLSENQWVTVRTKQFKDWFGDWENDPEDASKVVDENGEPMVVYHGTKYSGFSVFNKNPMQHGYYFSDEDTASWYTGEGAEVVENIEEADGDGIYAVVLNMRKPLVLDYNGYGALDYDNTGLEAPDFYMQHLPAQYDGIICENIKDYGGFNGGYVEKDDNDIPIMPAEGKVYAVKNNTQIKSATDNVGAFDAANPDIRYRKVEATDGVEAANKRFNEELDAYVNHQMTKNDMLHLGMPSGVLAHFLPNLPMVMRQRILTKASVKKHNVDPFALRNMPKMMSHPVFIFQRADNAIGILTEMKDRDGKNVCVAIDLAKTIQDGGETLEVNDIRSIHGREISDIVYPLLKNGTLKWVDKEKGLAYLSSASRHVQQEIDKQDLSSAAKIVEDFENPVIKGENVSEPEVWEQSHDENVGERTHERTSLPNEMRRVSSSNDKELSVTRLPSDTNLPLKTYEGKDCEVSVGEALTAINNLRGDYVTLDGHSLTSSKDTRRKLGNVLRTGKDNDDLRVALSHVPEILSSSVLVEEHRDRTKVDGVRKSENPSDPNIEKVQVYYGPVKINGKLYRVKTTVPVFMTGNNRIRGYEIGNMELSSPTPTVDSQGVGRLRTSSISLANLLKNVEFSYEKGKKILDEIDKSDSDAPTTPAEAEESDVLYRESTEDNDASKGRFIFEGEPVSELSGTEFGDLSKDLKEEVARYFTDEWGGSVERPGFGDVILDKRSVKDDVSHGMNRQKAASFMAVPYIIRDGVVIDEQENWKGRNYDSVTIAAPITIGKERCIGIAIVKRQPGSNRFYLHTVMLQKSLQVGMLRTGTEAASRQGDIAKILNNLYHAVKKDENLSREGDGAYSDDELSELNDPFVKMLGEKARSAKQRKAFAARERRNMADAVRELAERLHLDNVEIVTEPMEVKDRRGKVHHPKGFFNTKTGKITVVIPNHANVEDAVQTLLHEAVAHYGLRQLFGEHFDTFLRNVYEAADMDVRRRITELALRKYGGDFRVATEEYLASLAEDTDFENIPHGFWQKIKRMFLAMLHAIGFDGFDDMGVTLSDNELRYILWRSYENLKEPGEHRSILGEAEDVAKLVELKVGNYGDTAAEEESADVAERREEKIGRLTPDFLQAFRTWLLVKRDYDKSVRDDPTSERSQALRDEFNACKGWMYDAMDMLHDLDLNINLRELLKDNGFNERELKEYDYWFGGDGVAESKIRGYKPHEKSIAWNNSSHGFTQEEYDKFASSTIGKTVKDGDIDKLLSTLKATSDVEPAEIPFTEDNYKKLFGNGVDTPIGHVKMSENQSFKMQDNGRQFYLSLAQSTLKDPDFVLSVPSQAKDGKKTERPYSYIFVKIFRNADGSYVTYYNAVSVQQQGMEVVMSNYIKSERKIKNDIKEGTLAYIKKATVLSASDTTVHGNQRTNPVGGSSAAKLGNNSETSAKNSEKVSEPEVWEQSNGENVDERTHERTSLQAGEDNSADRLRTHERTSLQNGEDRLRTHEGTAVQNGEGTHEGTSQQAGEVTDARPEAWGKKDLLSKAEQISNGVDPELLFRDSIEDDDNTARETYNRMADEKKNIIREAWQDSMINVRNLQEAVLKQRSEKAEAWEDAYNEENRMHGRSRAESEYFTDNFYKPLLKAVNAVAKAAKVSVGDVTEYMMAKHGVERNIVFASRDAQKAYDKAHQKAQEEYEALMNAAFAESDAKKRDALMRRAQKVKFPDHDELYNHYRGRDYSGLTDLTGKDDVQEAEAEAQRIVADMESRSDTSELWKATNAATEWTLKKAYESGMMSRDNYNQVRSMFSYYIPLRGWEEDTAGDLYDYVGSGDKGTAFSPTLHKAKGRRSQADNPIAYIGSMAVSAIVQGNKNKVKQTFMRFAENHPTNLITVSEMWYRNYGTDAAPDWREAHEHYAPFCRSNKPISRCKKGLFTTRKCLFKKKTVKPIPPISTHIITF